MKAYLDKDTCISCGLCPSICPEVFEMQDDGKAGVFDSGDAELKEVVPEEFVDSVKEAAEACPVAAISTE
ncbi:MAG: ferredoxin [Clostridiaceae bacterium]|nr:ferredoxin [Clostridiaceae bacterium]